MAVDIVAEVQNILDGMFLARSTYGGEYIDPAFNIGGDNDAELNDDYRGYIASQVTNDWQLLSAAELPTFDGNGGKATFTGGGLYNAKVNFGTENTFDAQGLLAVHGDTLVLSFRGTDGKDPAVEDGQAFIADSLVAHYKAFRPLINAAYDFLQAHAEIGNVVISGHSLGGAMVDLFALLDAARFRLLRPEGLTMVSLASSGLPPELPQAINGLDTSAAIIGEKTITVFGIDITVPVLDGLIPPADYISFANSQDRVHFPHNFPDLPEAPGLVPIATLKDNLQFGADVVFHNPNIDNTDVIYYDPIDHPLDFRGMGAEHNSALLWANLQGLETDPLLANYHGQRLIFGITDYNAVPDIDGTAIDLFKGYLFKDVPGNDNDNGTYTLKGTIGADFILGLTGNDRLEGRGASDLLSGGAGNDVLLGGGGADRISGGTGRDVSIGGAGADRFIYTATSDSVVGAKRDVIADYNAAAGDLINVSAIDARESVTGNQRFAFIFGAEFTAEGQIRAIDDANGTILQFNTAGTSGSEMEILLRGISAASLTGAEFIL